MDKGSVRKYVAEAFGTFVLTFFGCGSAVVLGTGGVFNYLGIAMAFGLSIVAMAFVIGGVSGCHINPAVSLGLFLDKRLSGKDLAGYMVGQFIGGIVAALLLWLVIETCSIGGVSNMGIGTNGYGEASATGINIGGALLIEIILTCVFVLVVLGATGNPQSAPFAGIIIGLSLAFVHIMGLPFTGTSVNPARSFGPALVMAFNGNMTAIAQVWVFIVAPLVGGALAAGIYAYFKGANAETDESDVEAAGKPEAADEMLEVEGIQEDSQSEEFETLVSGEPAESEQVTKDSAEEIQEVAETAEGETGDINEDSDGAVTDTR